MPPRNAIDGETQWTVVLTAAHKDGTQAQQALNQLAQTYWRPLYAYLRRCGYSQSDAEDLTQGYFARLLEKNYLGAVDRNKGKFRAFLLTSLKHFVANELDKQRACKRGGQASFTSWDLRDAESWYQSQPLAEDTPEAVFHRRWALTILDRALQRLREEYVQHRSEPLFNGIKHALMKEPDSPTYAELGRQLKMSVAAVKTAVYRLRARGMALLREEVAQTVDDPALVDAEMQELLNRL